MARSLRERHGKARLRTVALIGIDGSGKTTQAHHLAEALTVAGRPATYHRNAGGRRWLGRLAHRLGRPDAERLVGRRGLLAVESVLRWLAIAAALLSCVVTGRTAVMDRYSACQYASIRAHGGQQRWERLARGAYRLFPSPQVTFLLTVDPAEAYRRIELRGTDHESMGWLTAADTAYRALPEFPTFVVVDAGRPPEEVSRRIQEHLAGWLPAGTAAGTDPAAPAEPVRPGSAGPVRPGPAEPVRPSPAEPVRPGPAGPVRPAPAEPVRPGSTAAPQPGAGAADGGRWESGGLLVRAPARP